MRDLIDRLLDAWADPPGDEEAAVAAFGRLYTDPVSINGTSTPLADIVRRARALHESMADLSWQVLDRVEHDGKVAFAFRLGGRHVGVLPTPMGDLPATGRWVESLGMDLLTLVDGRVASIWVTHDELGRLVGLGGVSLTSPG